MSYGNQTASSNNYQNPIQDGAEKQREITGELHTAVRNVEQALGMISGLAGRLRVPPPSPVEDRVSQGLGNTINMVVSGLALRTRQIVDALEEIERLI